MNALDVGEPVVEVPRQSVHLVLEDEVLYLEQLEISGAKRFDPVT